MEVFKNEFIKCEYHESSSLMEMIWSEDTEKMTVEEYKKSLSDAVVWFERYKPRKSLLDVKKMKFAVLPELQIWTNENIIKRIVDAGLLYTAILESDEILTDMSVEQIYDEKIARRKTNVKFDDREKALKWLGEMK